MDNLIYTPEEYDRDTNLAASIACKTGQTVSLWGDDHGEYVSLGHKKIYWCRDFTERTAFLEGMNYALDLTKGD